MQTQRKIGTNSGEFLVRKSVFLLTSSVGQAMAAKIVAQGLETLRIQASTLTEGDMARLSVVIEPSLRAFVGDDKASRLASALRVLVGGARVETGGQR